MYKISPPLNITPVTMFNSLKKRINVSVAFFDINLTPTSPPDQLLTPVSNSIVLVAAHQPSSF